MPGVLLIPQDVAVTEKRLDKIAPYISTTEKLTSIAVQLGFQKHDVEIWETNNNRNITEASFAMLAKWKKKRATSNRNYDEVWKELFDALAQSLTIEEMEAIYKKITTSK